MTPSRVPNVRLDDGVDIPQLGFGTFRVEPDDTERIVSQALEAGFRHIDTAAAYRNEEGVGRAIRASGIPRDEIFVTTKLFNTEHARASAFAAIDASLERLGLEFVDLYLIHWPVPAQDLYVEAWTAMEEMKRDGRTRSIGVSNFQIPHLERLARETGTVPSVNQIELHPRFTQKELRDYDRDHGIATESWGPLGIAKVDIIGIPTIVNIAAELGVTPAQVTLRWHLQHGLIVFPKTVSADRMRENFDVFGFELSEEQMVAIDVLDEGKRYGGDPDTV